MTTATCCAVQPCPPRERTGRPCDPGRHAAGGAATWIDTGLPNTAHRKPTWCSVQVWAQLANLGCGRPGADETDTPLPLVARANRESSTFESTPTDVTETTRTRLCVFVSWRSAPQAPLPVQCRGSPGPGCSGKSRLSRYMQPRAPKGLDRCQVRSSLVGHPAMDPTSARGQRVFGRLKASQLLSRTRHISHHTSRARPHCIASDSQCQTDDCGRTVVYNHKVVGTRYYRRRFD